MRRGGASPSSLTSRGSSKACCAKVTRVSGLRERSESRPSPEIGYTSRKCDVHKKFQNRTEKRTGDGLGRRQLRILTTANNLLRVVQHGSALARYQPSLPSPGPVRLVLEAASEIDFPPFAFPSAATATPGHQTSLTSEREPPAKVHVQRQVPGSEGQV